MKKVTIILLSMLLVLSIGQAAFAKGSVAIGGGYLGFFAAADNLSEKGFKINLSGDYEFTSKWSIAGGFSFSRATDEDDYKYLILNPSVYGRYKFLETETVNLGVQAGVSYYNAGYTHMDDETSELVHGDTSNTISLNLGVFANIYVLPKLQIYGDLKIPLLQARFYEDSDNNHTGFPEKFLIDATLGIQYEITSSIFVGLEGAITSGSPGIGETDGFGVYEIDYIEGPTFSIGAKVGYSF